MGTTEPHFNTVHNLATKFQETGTVQDASRSVRPDLSNFISFHLLYLHIVTICNLGLIQIYILQYITMYIQSLKLKQS